MRALGSFVFALVACAHAPATKSPSAGPHRFASGGVELAYHVAGRGPVLVAHSGGPGAEWSYLRMPEVEEQFTVVYLEPVGTGTSGKLPYTSSYDIDRYVADIDALRAELGLSQIYLLGHSHGGFVAQAYALAHPDRLIGLVLYDTSPTTGPEWQQDVEANLAWFADEPWFEDATKALSEESSAKTDDELTAIFHREAPLYFAHYTEREAELAPKVAAIRISVLGEGVSDPSAPPEVGMAPPFDVRARLGEIRTPTVIIVGERDFVCSKAMAQLIHEGIAGSRLVVLENSGHMGHVEEPAAFAQAVAQIIQ